MTSPARIAFAAAAALTMWSSAAFSSPVQWTLTDVLFEDGGTATGSFVYDADTNEFSTISIATSGGTLSPPASYSSLLIGSAGDAALVPAAGPDLTGSALLQLIFQFPLTNAGGIVFLIDPFFPTASSFEGTCLNAACTSVDFGRLMVDGGVIGTPLSATVPVPAGGALLFSAIGLLGGLRRLRHVP
jgi:hypothetical protein